MKNQKQNILLPLIVFAVLALLAWLLVTLVGGVTFGESSVKTPVLRDPQMQSDEASYLASLTEANKGAQGIQDSNQRAQSVELRNQLERGEIDVWPLFDDAAILGDVRAADFARYGFVPESRVFAGDGDTINAISDHLDALKALQPKYIFLCYGLNDASVGVWNTPEEYASAFILQISQLNQAVPGACVIVSSILPVQEPARSQTPQWQNLPQLSAAVESACQEYGIRFVSNDVIIKANENLYGTDGIRLEQDFYRIWAIHLMVGALS